MLRDLLLSNVIAPVLLTVIRTVMVVDGIQPSVVYHQADQRRFDLQELVPCVTKSILRSLAGTHDQKNSVHVPREYGWVRDKIDRRGIKNDVVVKPTELGQQILH